jgi:hypothetical protein
MPGLGLEDQDASLKTPGGVLPAKMPMVPLQLLEASLQGLFGPLLDLRVECGKDPQPVGLKDLRWIEVLELLEQEVAKIGSAPRRGPDGGADTEGAASGLSICLRGDQTLIQHGSKHSVSPAKGLCRMTMRGIEVRGTDQTGQ